MSYGLKTKGIEKYSLYSMIFRLRLKWMRANIDYGLCYYKKVQWFKFLLNFKNSYLCLYKHFYYFAIFLEKTWYFHLKSWLCLFSAAGTRLHRGFQSEATMDDKPPDITHLVFVIHGIGQKMETGKIIRCCSE